MTNILAIAAISYKEGLRQRLLYGVVIFALLIMAFSVLVSGLFMRDISKVTLDFCLTAINIGGLLVPFFMAVHLFAKDIERRTIYSILARPVSRSEYILGKFGGLVLLTGTIMALLTIAAFIAVWGSMQMYAGYFFKNLSWSAIFLCAFISFLGITLLNACVVLWCSITSSSFLATLLTLFTYLIGQTVEDMVRFVTIDVTDIKVSLVVKKTVQIVYYIFPNLAAFDLKLPAAHGITILPTDILFLIIYGIGYSAAALLLAIFVFSRRDLP